MSSFLHNIILKGGGNTLRKNIALYKSPAWEKGILMLGQKPYYRLYPENDNFIKTAQNNNTHLLIVNEKITSLNTKLKIGYLPNGIYSVRVFSNGKQFVKRIIKE